MNDGNGRSFRRRAARRRGPVQTTAARLKGGYFEKECNDRKEETQAVRAAGGSRFDHSPDGPGGFRQSGSLPGRGPGSPDRPGQRPDGVRFRRERQQSRKREDGQTLLHRGGSPGRRDRERGSGQALRRRGDGRAVLRGGGSFGRRERQRVRRRGGSRTFFRRGRSLDKRDRERACRRGYRQRDGPGRERRGQPCRPGG